jgi:hypothetical protein
LTNVRCDTHLKALTAARKAEGATAHKERVARGQWISTLNVSRDDRDRELEESALPGPSKVQTL